MRKCGFRVFDFVHLRISTERERERGRGKERNREREYSRSEEARQLRVDFALAHSHFQ